MHLLKSVFLLTTVFLVSACTSGITGEASYIGTRHEMNSSTQNPVLGMRIALDDIKTTRVNDLLQANIQLRNKWPFSQDVQYRIHWFDEQGMELEPERVVWNKIILTGKSERSIKVTAPTSKAVEVRVTIRD